MKDMLRNKNIIYENLPAFFRFGTFARRVTCERELTEVELARIPEQHRPCGPILRSDVQEFVLEYFLARSNREKFVFPRDVDCLELKSSVPHPIQAGGRG